MKYQRKAYWKGRIGLLAICKLAYSCKLQKSGCSPDCYRRPAATQGKMTIINYTIYVIVMLNNWKVLKGAGRATEGTWITSEAEGRASKASGRG